MHKYDAKVFSIILSIIQNSEDARDIYQEVFIKVWSHIDKFREDSQLFTWIYKIATNECLNFLKRKKRKFCKTTRLVPEGIK